MHGIINLNKPTGITSAKALYRVRRITSVRKSGHAGTLDPGADGVLLLCLGRGTKLVELLMDQPKVYRASARLDVTSESFDSDDELKPVSIDAPPDDERVAAAFARFEGRIQQTPPKISAVKVGGRPAYKLARSGAALELRARPVRVYWIRLLGYEWPHVKFAMACGRGTYVRSLIRDVGAALGTGGCLTSLTRTLIGPFRLEDAYTFEALEALDDWTRALHSLERCRARLAAPIEAPPPDRF